MKSTSIAIIITAVLIGGAIMFSGGDGNQTAGTEVPVNNVEVVNGTQYISISARGGYVPRVTKAQADVPTILRVDTQGTFDCSAALSIPSLGFRKNLPPTGQTEIEIPPQKAGTTMRGLCAMGMYNFSIEFN